MGEPSEPAGRSSLDISIPVRTVTRVLTVIVVGLVATTFLAQLLKNAGVVPDSIIRLFDSNEKVNFPTGYKLVALLGCTVLLWLVGMAKEQEGDRFARHWVVLSLIFGFLFLDEMAYLHQTLSGMLERHASFGGSLKFPWVAVYLPLLAVLAFAYWRFFWSLQPRFRWLFLIAAICFAGGSGGIEIFKGVAVNEAGFQSLRFGLLAALSDSLEEVGLLVFLYALLTYLGLTVGEVRLGLVPRRVPAAQEERWRTDVAEPQFDVTDPLSSAPARGK